MACTKCNCENLNEQLRTHIIALSQIWKYTKDVSASSSIAALRNNILLKHFRLHQHHHQRFLTQLQHRQRHHFQSNSHSHPMNRCHVCSHRSLSLSKTITNVSLGCEWMHQNAVPSYNDMLCFLFGTTCISKGFS